MPKKVQKKAKRQAKNPNGYPRPLSLCRFKYDKIRKEDHHYYPFCSKLAYVFLGEHPNMPGHGVFVCYETGQVFCGRHPSDFEELSEDET